MLGRGHGRDALLPQREASPVATPAASSGEKYQGNGVNGPPLVKGAPVTLLATDPQMRVITRS